MSDQKILAVEYEGQRYEGNQLRRVMALAPEPLHSNILVEYEDADEPGGVLRMRPFRFSSSEVSFAPDGTARLY